MEVAFHRIARGAAVWDIIHGLIPKLPALTCVVCFVFSGAIARTFLRNNEQLFPVMALFALVWAIDVPYWLSQEPMTKAALGICTSFLTIYIGGLLLSLTAGEVRPWQRLLQNLLQNLSFVLFSGCLLWAIIFEETYKGLPSRDAAFFVELILGAGGLALVAWGIGRMFGTRAAIVLASIFFLFTASFFTDYANKNFNLGESFQTVIHWSGRLHSFTSSVLKVLYTLTFGLLMGFAGIDAKRRQELWWPLIGKFVALHCRFR
jgi:hypothetical protein